MYVSAMKRGDDSSHRRLFSLYERKEEKEDKYAELGAERNISCFVLNRECARSAANEVIISMFLHQLAIQLNKIANCSDNPFKIFAHQFFNNSYMLLCESFARKL